MATFVAVLLLLCIGGMYAIGFVAKSRMGTLGLSDVLLSVIGLGVCSALPTVTLLMSF